MVGFNDEMVVHNNVEHSLLFLEGYSAVLSVSNENSQTMVCKIEAKVEDCYHISPPFFFLRSSETVFVKSKHKSPSEYQIILSLRIIYQLQYI